MPEGPELKTSADFVNSVCDGKNFGGRVVKSSVSKNPEIDWDEPNYHISACSRGKELMLLLRTIDTSAIDKRKAGKKKRSLNGKILNVKINFGMSGKFCFVDSRELPKHAHLKFYTRCKRYVLSFVDARRFGRWEVTKSWGNDRGPCIILEYSMFRKNVLENINKPLFERAVCEVLLNQSYFNGVGNYLRAEVLHHLKIAPFTRTKDVLEKILRDENDGKAALEKKQVMGRTDVEEDENLDLLSACHRLSMQVVQLSAVGESSTMLSLAADKPSAMGSLAAGMPSTMSSLAFVDWLKCYGKPGMSNCVDRNGRTIWYEGPAGPLVPKVKTKKLKVCRRKISLTASTDSADKESNIEAAKKKVDK